MDSSIAQEDILLLSIEQSAAERGCGHLLGTNFADLTDSLVAEREMLTHATVRRHAIRAHASVPTLVITGFCFPDTKFQSRLRLLSQAAASALVVFLVFTFLGMQYEQAQMRKLSKTEYLYKTSKVCGLSYDYSTIQTSTFASIADMDQHRRSNNSSTVVAHCGDCGTCSNPHDINIYDQTKTSLYKDSLVCAKHSLLGGYDAATRCMSERVGLSDDCNECWVENIMCDRSHCVFSCIWEAIVSHGIHGGSTSERLNRCTQCDELRCGPAFLKCAGANRRRTAIKSDIVRDPTFEVCSSVQSKWWLDQELQTIWQQNNGKNVTKRDSTRARSTGIRGTRRVDSDFP